METILIRETVCTSCLSAAITDPNCRCADSKYETIELEFTACAHCKTILDDGNPPETEFNIKQLGKDGRNS